MGEAPEIKSIEECHRIADLRADAGDFEASRAIGYATYMAESRHRQLAALAWACTEKNSRKRNESLQRVLMALEANEESLAAFPMRMRAAS